MSLFYAFKLYLCRISSYDLFIKNAFNTCFEINSSINLEISKGEIKIWTTQKLMVIKMR